MNKDEAYLDINVESFEKDKQQAKEDFNAEYPNDEVDSTYHFPDLEFDCYEDEFKDGYLTLSGNLKNPKTDNDLGHVSIKMKMDSERTIQVIEAYMKKLGKLKTVLEATK